MKQERNLGIFEKVIQVRQNLRNLQEKMSDYINMHNIIEKLYDIIDDPSYYDYIWNELIALEQLRDNVLNNLPESEFLRKEGFQQLISQFEKLDEFQNKFMDKIFANLGNCFELAQKNPKSIVCNFKILQKADKILESKKKPQVYVKKLKEILKETVRVRFEEKFKEKITLEEILQTMKFTIKDRSIISDIIAPCFPAEHKIDELFNKEYNKNVEERIFPIIKDQKKLKESPGMLITLASWLDNYEDNLRSVGVENPSLHKLINDIKMLMPLFVDHIETQLSKEISNAFNEDSKNIQSEKLKELAKEEMDIITNLSVDVFMLINQNLDIIVENGIQGEMYMNIIIIHQKILRDKLTIETQNIVSFDTQNIQLAAYLNNFNQFKINLKELSMRYKQFTKEIYQQRINNLVNQTKQCIWRCN